MATGPANTLDEMLVAGANPASPVAPPEAPAHKPAGWLRKSGLFEPFAAAAGGLLIFVYCVSYGALIFQGELFEGAPFAVWGLMISAAFAGVIAGSFTKLAPSGFAPNSAAVALLASLVVSIDESVKAAGATPGERVANAMAALWLAGLASYVFMWALGYCRAARFFRFVPYSVVAGFLGATGVLLIAAGFSLSAGHTFTGAIQGEDLTQESLEKLAASLTLAALILLVQTSPGKRLLIPLGALLAGALAVLLARLSAAPAAQLFLQSALDLKPWLPFDAIGADAIRWPTLAAHLPQIAAVAIVVQISNVVKISGVEVARRQAADLDSEFRYTGAGALAAAALGGIGASLSSAVTGALTKMGSRTRLSGILAACIAGALLLLKIDIFKAVPVPVLGGLVLYVGISLVIDSFRLPLLQRAWLDLIPALGIMAVCLRYGHIAGVVAGIILACVMFSYSYAKLGPVKRHVTGAALTSNVVRAGEHAAILKREGDAIHIYWVSGYLFFGSSDRLFEEIRRGIEKQHSPAVSYVILDLTEATGADASAVMSLLKLKNFCAERAVQLVSCGLKDALRAKLAAGGASAEWARRLVFADRNDALAWCETDLLERREACPASLGGTLDAWLGGELGPEAAEAILPYFERKLLKAGDVLYQQGDAAQTIDLVAEGSVAIVIRRDGAPDYRLRLMKTHTVVGEMGFFRHALRAASVISAEDSAVYALTRDAFARLELEKPAVANRFLEFIIRILANRIDFANRETAALL